MERYITYCLLLIAYCLCERVWSGVEVRLMEGLYHEREKLGEIGAQRFVEGRVADAEGCA